MQLTPRRGEVPRAPKPLTAKGNALVAARKLEAQSFTSPPRPLQRALLAVSREANGKANGNGTAQLAAPIAKVSDGGVVAKQLVGKSAVEPAASEAPEPAPAPSTVPTAPAAPSTSGGEKTSTPAEATKDSTEAAPGVPHKKAFADGVPPAPAAAAAAAGSRSKLVWALRWGKWGGPRDVYVAAPHAVRFEVTDLGTSRSSSATSLGADLTTEMAKLLGSEIGASQPPAAAGQDPPQTMVVYVYEDTLRQSTVGGNKKLCIVAGLICKGSRVKKFKDRWQSRRLLDGRYVATFLSATDTAGKQHIEGARAEADGKGVVDSVSLGVPRSWLFRSLPEGSSSIVRKGTHWHTFFEVFGGVRQVELCWSSQSDQELQLLVQFVNPGCAKQLYEMLQGRYFWNPNLLRSQPAPFSDFADTYPIFCTLDMYIDLRSSAISGRCSVAARKDQLQAAVLPPPPLQVAAVAPPPLQVAASKAPPPAAPMPMPPAPAAGPVAWPMGVGTGMIADGPVFIVRRLNLVPGMRANEWEVRLTGFKPGARVGRDDDCDLWVRGLHMSRHHADFGVLQNPQDGSTGLWIKDNSTNGIHVNGRRLPKGQLVLLKDQDRITFEAENLHDPPAFRVQYFPSAAACDRDAAARQADAASVVGLPPAQLPVVSTLPVLPPPVPQLLPAPSIFIPPAVMPDYFLMGLPAPPPPQGRPQKQPRFS